MAGRHIVGGAVVVLVRDLERALRFYVDALGFHLRFRHAGPALGFAEVEGPGVKILLQESDLPTGGGPLPGAAPQVSLVFEVDALEPALEALASLGVRFEKEIREDAEYRTVGLADPDGTPLELRKPKR